MAADTQDSTLSKRPMEELVQIAAAGGGIELNMSRRPTAELVQIASAAAHGGSPIRFRGIAARPTNELVEIAAAGNGQVIFVDTPSGQ